MEATKPLLLFDLGGVVVEFSGLADMHGLLREPMPVEDVNRLFSASQAIADFEVGLLTPEEFGAAFANAWSLNCSEAEFLAHYESWTRALLPGADALLTELAASYRLAALSNSNILHWTRNDVVIGVQSYFERAFSSHELGVRKPDPEIFRRALSELGVEPAEVVFFDDNALNVEAAQAFGISAHRVEGVDQVRARLADLGLL
ncbi:MAG: HAD family hydrolase [Dehalococcoidia bacterium]